jgi:glycosyltransferase involved in cell wall biosynthesis
MLIGIDASRANRDHKTGTEWYSYYLIRWLAKLDKKNEYILYSNQPLQGGLLDLTTQQYFGKGESWQEIKFDRQGYQIIKSPHNNFRGKILKWPFRYFWTQGRMSLEMLCCRPDVLFIPAHVLPIIHPKKSVVTIHDIGYERSCQIYDDEMIMPTSSFSYRLLNWLIHLLTRGKCRANKVSYLNWSTNFSLKHADRIITISNFSKEEILKLFPEIKKEKIYVIYNGYNQYLYKKITDQKKINNVLIKYGIEQPYLFYIGRIEKKKNIPNLIEAFAILRERVKDLPHKLVLAGDAGFGYDEIKYMIREFDLVDEVIMPGWVDEIDVPYFYSGADAFVFPSNYEGFGIPLLQAMACGVPITASEAASIPEVAGDAALLFNPAFAFSIAEALERIIKDEDLRHRLLAAGTKRIKNFSWEKTGQETLKVIGYRL